MFPSEIINPLSYVVPEEQSLWIISNELKINGATSMLYEDKLHELADHLGTDLYIMPSSLHEVLAISSAAAEPEALAEMVLEVNTEEVALKDKLSNQVYHYDKDKRKLSLATDTPYKKLDAKKNNEDITHEQPQTRRHKSR